MKAGPARLVLLVALLAAYVAVFASARLSGRNGDRLDPLTPRPRAVERAIGERRFADALPLALEDARATPRDPLPQHWLALIEQGLGRADEEAAAWERYAALSSAPGAGCPDLPEAYARAGHDAQALAAYERCAKDDDTEPQRLIDLAAAYARNRRFTDARVAYERAARLDPLNPAIPSRIASLGVGK